MKQKLPKEITVGARKYAVVRKYARLSDLGEIRLKDATIAVATQDKFGNRLTKQEQDRVFWHELTHGILHDMGHPLYRNERFVENFADRLTKAILSAKF